MASSQRPFWPIGWLIAAVLLTHGWLIFSSRFNSDEPQHAHVAWQIAHGHPHYTDVIDNHAPLFYSVWSPLIWRLPATPVSLTILRLTMLLPWLVQLAATYALARFIAPRRLAILLTLLIATLPDVMVVAVEFRPDSVWAALWLTSIALLATARRRTRRFAVAGLLVGCAFAISLKTAPLLGSLGVAYGLHIIGLRGRRSKSGAAPLIRHSPATVPSSAMAAFFLAALIAPIGVIFWQQHLGGVGAMIQQTLTDNIRLGDRLAGDVWLARGGWIAIMLALAVAARRWMPRSHAGRRRTWIALLGFTTYATFRLLWPVWERQDTLPVMPLLALAIAALLLGARRYARSRGAAVDLSKPAHCSATRQRLNASSHTLSDETSLARWTACAMVTATLALLAVAIRTSVRHRGTYEATFASINEAARLLAPGDRVVDPKGDFVFYRRPMPTVYEKLTRHRLNRRPEYDDGPMWLERNPAAVAVAGLNSFPIHTREWLRARYVVVGHIAVAGCRFDPPLDQPRTFELPIVGRYAWRGRSDLPPATIDGQPVFGTITLAAGVHTLAFSAPPTGPAALVWQPAIDAGMGVDWSRRPR